MIECFISRIKWSINTCEINKPVIKAVFNLGIKLVICGRDDFTCKEPLLLTLRALIDEEYRDTCKGKCKFLWTGQVCSLVFPDIGIYYWFWFGRTQSTFAFICGHLAITDWTIAKKYRAQSSGEKLSQRLLTVITSDSNTWSYLNPRKTLTCRGLYRKQNPLIKETIVLSPYRL